MRQAKAFVVSVMHPWKYATGSFQLKQPHSLRSYTAVRNRRSTSDFLRAKQADGYSARIGAGFCWPWSDHLADGTLVDDVQIGDWRRPWNSSTDRETNGIPPSSLWATHPAGFGRIGCIYTAQGFEYDYAGVIFGDDLIWTGQDWQANRRANKDKEVHGAPRFGNWSATPTGSWPPEACPARSSIPPTPPPTGCSPISASPFCDEPTPQGTISLTQVLIHPSGNAEALRHWKITLNQPIDYHTDPYATPLTLEERTALDALHPDGKARFWGATGIHDAKMAKLRTGDIVLLTGKNHVRAVGEIGHSFRNASFADTLWSPHAKHGSWHNVYSLLNYEQTAIPYTEIWDLPGFTPGDNFMGLRLLDAEKSRNVLDGLGIETLTERAITTLNDSGVQVIGVEAVNILRTSFDRLGGTTLVNRVEAHLVQSYQATLGVAVARFRAPAGITDLYIVTSDDTEIVEAKRSADHAFVRQALGQLLDYGPHSPQPVTRLTGLFPAQPTDADTGLLHRYGIDCVYKTESGAFVRIPAPASQREAMMKIIQSDDPITTSKRDSDA
ncbi:DNA/RNA helicase domain-containing protein [Acrocarpospora macrocephala]|nr:DNA/RNA helicase domain-containing protein [Acrocarpospora macrocephala]